MILLLGGTSETAPLAEALAAVGYRVLVSTATDIPLAVGSHEGIEHRRGRLSEAEMTALIRERGIKALVDATHPYATQVRTTAVRAADGLGIPYLTLIRPGLAMVQDGVCIAGDHDEAARIACECGKPVLLTIGSRNVRPYAEAARQVGIPLVARVLDHPDSHHACREAQIPETHVITGRGPFSTEENRRLIRQFDIGVLVTKDSGDAGGVSEKLEAARLEGCLAIVVGRPESVRLGGFENIVDLVEALKTRLTSKAGAAPDGCRAVKASDPGIPATCESGGTPPHSKTLARSSITPKRDSVLECGAAAPISYAETISKEGFDAVGSPVSDAATSRLPGKPPGAQARKSGAMLAMDLESVLVPEIWETVARVAEVPELAMTTRDIGDYDVLMQHRIALCREHGLTLSRLREIVATMEPFPGAAEFFAWAQSRALVVIVSDTFHELAGPVVSKLGFTLMICNSLSIDGNGYISGFEFHSPTGKAGVVTRFQRLGFHVIAVGDSFNDLAMLQSADAAFLFRPSPCVLEKGITLPAIWEFEQLQTVLHIQF